MTTFIAPPRLDLPLDQRTYIVTGAGGGIGRAAVARLLGAGSRVVGVDLSSRRLAETETETRELPGTLRTIKVDVTSESDVATAVDYAISEFGACTGWPTSQAEW